MNRVKLFEKITEICQNQITRDFLESLKTQNGNTQSCERQVIEKIKGILDSESIPYKQAGSQQSKDFREVGGVEVGLNIEIKKTDSTRIMCNDTCPSSDIYYIILMTGAKTSKFPPQLVFLNGAEIIQDSPWVAEYQREINEIKDKWCRGDCKKALTGPLEVYCRPNYSFILDSFAKKSDYITMPEGQILGRIDKTYPDYEGITIDHILECKTITPELLLRDYNNLCRLTVDENPRSFAGNKIVYHFYFKEMLQTDSSRKGFTRLIDLYRDMEPRKNLIDSAIKYPRRTKMTYLDPVDIYEIHRKLKGSINTFKPSIAKYIYKQFGATRILDPCAGWGGRMLGAMALNLESYMGFDTNPVVVEKSRELKEFFKPEADNIKVIEGNCLEQDFSAIEYDFVLTSPPYFNLEIYTGMTEFSSNDQYYIEFLKPLIYRCRINIREGGHVCINISDYIYNDYLKLTGDREADIIFELKQQTGGKKNKEKVYIWKCDKI
jgi:hypothetical protein